MTPSSKTEHPDSLTACAEELDAILGRCAAAYPDFEVSPSDFKDALIRATDKYQKSFAAGGKSPSTGELSQFIGELHDLDLYLTIACTRGNERAWWHFDRQHRPFIERLAHHLAGRGVDADEVIDSVYSALLGTKTVSGGTRESKFKTYTGRGTLRGWLRALVLHAAVDLYRVRKAEMPLEDWSENDDKPSDAGGGRAGVQRTEDLMLANVTRDRYKAVTIAALDRSLATLDDHETLLLLYYHVEGLKLREIARLVEKPASPFRRWFRRQSKRPADTSPSRVHESTVMRWLEKVYRKVSDRFRGELAGKHRLSPAEIEICLSIATEDLGQDVRLNAVLGADTALNKAEAG